MSEPSAFDRLVGAFRIDPKKAKRFVKTVCLLQETNSSFSMAEVATINGIDPRYAEILIEYAPEMATATTPAPAPPAPAASTTTDETTGTPTTAQDADPTAKVTATEKTSAPAETTAQTAAQTGAASAKTRKTAPAPAKPAAASGSEDPASVERTVQRKTPPAPPAPVQQQVPSGQAGSASAATAGTNDVAPTPVATAPVDIVQKRRTRNQTQMAGMLVQHGFPLELARELVTTSAGHYGEFGCLPIVGLLRLKGDEIQPDNPQDLKEFWEEKLGDHLPPRLASELYDSRLKELSQVVKALSEDEKNILDSLKKYLDKYSLWIPEAIFAGLHYAELHLSKHSVTPEALPWLLNEPPPYFAARAPLDDTPVPQETMRGLRDAGSGLRNTGNHSFLNAGLQMLAALCFTSRDLPAALEKREEHKPMAHALVKLRCDMMKGIADPLEVKSQTKFASSTREEDVHELLRDILQKLIKEFPVAENFFGMSLLQKIDCSRPDCPPIVRGQHEKITCLSLEVAGPTMQECLNSYMKTKYDYSPEHSCKSEGCDSKYVKLSRHLPWQDRPPVLLIHLKRFKFDKIERTYTKNHQRIVDSRILKVPVSDGCGVAPSYAIYHLAAVVRHVGPGPNCGHYSTHSFRISNSGTYKGFIFDDDDILGDQEGLDVTEDGYMFLYVDERAAGDVVQSLVTPELIKYAADHPSTTATSKRDATSSENATATSSAPAPPAPAPATISDKTMGTSAETTGATSTSANVTSQTSDQKKDKNRNNRKGDTIAKTRKHQKDDDEVSDSTSDSTSKDDSDEKGRDRKRDIPKDGEEWDSTSDSSKDDSDEKRKNRKRETSAKQRKNRNMSEDDDEKGDSDDDERKPSAFAPKTSKDDGPGSDSTSKDDSDAEEEEPSVAPSRKASIDDGSVIGTDSDDDDEEEKEKTRNISQARKRSKTSTNEEGTRKKSRHNRSQESDENRIALSTKRNRKPAKTSTVDEPVSRKSATKKTKGVKTKSASKTVGSKKRAMPKVFLCHDDCAKGDEHEFVVYQEDFRDQYAKLPITGATKKIADTECQIIDVDTEPDIVKNKFTVYHKARKCRWDCMVDTLKIPKDEAKYSLPAIFGRPRNRK